MVTNVSFKTDDEFGIKIYSEAKKRGITKSAFIKQELEKVLGSERTQEKRETNDSNVNMVNEETEKKNVRTIANIDLRLDTPKTDEMSELKKEDPKKEESKPSSDLVPNITQIEPTKLKEGNPTTSSYTELPATPILDSLIAKPIVDKPIEKSIDLNIKEIPQKPRYVIKKKVNRVTEDEGNVPADIVMEKKYREFKEKDKFNETFSDIHNRIRNIDDRVCKDGECTKKELENIKNEIGKLEGLKKNLDTSTSELTNLRKDLTDLKKDLPKVDVCPDCGEKAVLHLASFCSNCGTKMTEWTDDSGNKIPGWKPYWEKNKK